MRIEISSKTTYGDPRDADIRANLEQRLGSAVGFLRILDVYIIENLDGLTDDLAASLFVDPIAQDYSIDHSTVALDTRGMWTLLVEVTYKPGVTDPEALTAREALSIMLSHDLPSGVVVQSGTQYLLGLLSPTSQEEVSAALSNSLIELSFRVSAEEFAAGQRPPSIYPHQVPPSSIAVDRVPLATMDDEQLAALSQSRLLALEKPEMEAIRSYYADPAVVDRRKAFGVGADATDVELEMIAQTWSEHCKHKIFQAEIRYNDGPDTTHIDGLFPTFIKKVTDEVGAGKSYLRSVFVDNSGVVAFDDSCVLCFKAETHNSPSALDPYGGAITGIVGVNRDIIGTGKGARPIFNTDVLCFGYPETERALLPDGLLHPTTVMDGVHRGIIDGGNQSGIPVVAGGFLFDESYTGKPLVYCGTGGVMPSDVAGEGSWINHVDAGDLAVMVGGRIGKDGIHGATFSSLDLSESSPTSAVQIGDPITQRKMLDFLIEARDHGLFKGITDNGAGGLSSSLGEMAEKSGGVVINLDLCPLKYHGLAPWEILVSESQERMSLAVAPERLDELLELAVRRDVEATAIGRFTDTGRVEVFYREERVADLDLAFLHDGVPQMKLDATWIPPAERPSPRDERLAVADDLRRLEVSVDVLARVAVGLLGDPNIRSKETLVRQYDHEVQARSVVKPFCGPRADGHTDGGVLRVDHNSQWGITVTHGICPRYGDYDTYDMAACAVDEAFRAHIALGGDPETSAALDNFCWPDPIAGPANPDGEYKLAQLVRANHGLSDTCRAYGVPLISGKDSMKNDSTLGGAKLSVRPTLLISLMGFVKDVRHTVTTDLKRPGNRLYLLGPTKAELGGGALERLLLQKHRGISPWTENRAAPPAGACPRVDPRAAITRYRSLHQAILDELVESAHDLSDGGLFVALCESAIAGDLGASVDVSGVYHESAADSSPYPLVTSLFSESASRFLVEVAPSNVAAFEALFPRDLVPLGEVVAEPGLRITHGGAEVLRTEIEQLRRHWNGAERGTTW